MTYYGHPRGLGRNAMSSEKARWKTILLSYPCPTCGAEPGRPCRTSHGHVYYDVHVDRARQANRCPECGDRMPADAEAMDRCAYCETVNSIIRERYWRPR